MAGEGGRTLRIGGWLYVGEVCVEKVSFKVAH